MSKAIAVLGSDIHYSISTLALADAATRQMVAKANELNVPLVIAGDLHDTKAHHRAECQEAMLKTFSECREPALIMVGNHDRRNERSPEHALHFLKGAAEIIDRPATWDRGRLRATMIPYQHDAEDFKAALTRAGSYDLTNSLVICHQGIIGADMGHYVQDKSAVTKEDVADYRVISGHYHRRQDIKCGRPRKGAVGLFSYVGNPYTLSFGEAKDPEKGYQILMDDGTLDFVPTNLRRHTVLEYTASELLHAMYAVKGMELVGDQDLIWVKVRGPSAELGMILKKDVSDWLGRQDFRYDPIRTDVGTEAKVTSKMNPLEAMDAVIDGSPDQDKQKAELKRLYRELMS